METSTENLSSVEVFRCRELNVFSMNPSVLAFSINVRTFARSRPDGTSASILSFRITSLSGRVVSCSTTASTI